MEDFEGELKLLIRARYPIIYLVSWEERRLLASHGDDYRAYLRRVPRWLGWRATGPAMPPRVSLLGAIRSERSTLLVTGIVLLSLLFKGWSTAGG